MRIVLPFRGEFGITVRFHVPAVAALEGDVMVCHEPGLEALYPFALSRIIVPRKSDPERGWTKASDPAFMEGIRCGLRAGYPGAELVETDGRDEKNVRRFRPKPHEPQLDPAREWDVFVAPRKRQGAPNVMARNWDGWPETCQRLRSDGLRIFAGGMRETSYEVEADDAAWHYDRTLDATIEAMYRSKVVLATDAGLAHLAMLCGRPLIIVAAEGGRVAPGLRTDEPDSKFWGVRMKHYYEEANHAGAPLSMLPDGWHDIPGVIAAVKGAL